ncbi:hypothetical protein [Okeania sp. SIO3I5]|nr:hypothetical protein [Okeania sp. SIO3I5]
MSRGLVCGDGLWLGSDRPIAEPKLIQWVRKLPNHYEMPGAF